jgi:hypothetical protein
MNNLNIITNLINTSSDVEIDNLCNNIINNTYDNIYQPIIKLPFYKKSMEFASWNDNNLINIRLNYIEDWKDQQKINLIKLLIVFRYIDKDELHSNIGNDSKKTYSNGIVINDNSLSLKRFFNPNLKDQIDDFYINLDQISDQLIKLDIDKEIVKNISKEMIKLIEADIICRNKYDLSEFEEYKSKIIDILDTRFKENRFFELINKMRFTDLVNEPNHEGLRCVLYDSFNETRERYYWLAQLITYINNNSTKQWLIDNYKLQDFTDNNNSTKAKIIHIIAKQNNLNMDNIDQIIKFVFNIGQYYKHGTYFKWYNKEYEHIKMFDKYKDKSLNENLIELASKINPDTSIELIQQLLNIMNIYRNIMLEY